MDEKVKQCDLCQAAEFLYKCPRCDVHYCSVDCYKSQKHIKCSEEFYRSCIQDELSSAQPNSHEDMKKIYDILQRIRAADAGLGCDFADQLDSDDDDDGEQHGEDENDEDDELEDIAVRLQGVDLNDADKVWEHLSEAERLDFQRMIENGNITKLIPNYKPWWIKSKHTKIVEIDVKTTENKNETEPTIAKNIPDFSKICQKEPSPCVHYNLWNVLTAYTCVARFFSGEHLTTPIEAASHLVNLCATLKYGTNFEEADDAILSVEAEALTTGNGAPVAAKLGALFVESREELKNDARLVMSSTKNKLMALSDALKLFQLAKFYVKNQNGDQAAFQTIFALSNGSVELNRTKLNQFIKKIEFFLAFVNRDCGSGINHQ